MKKIYSLLLLAIVSVATALSASAAKLVVDDASHVDVTYYDSASGSNVTVEFVNNEAELTTFTSYYVNAVSPYIIKSVTASDYNTPYFTSSYASIYVTNENVTYTVETLDLEATRTATCTINVDEGSYVSASISGTNTYLSFHNGENILKFNPEIENVLSLSSTDYQRPLYQVKLNGEIVDGSGGYYQIILTDGCTVDITAKMPAVPATLTFEYGDNAFGAITAVSVNHQPVADFDGYTLSVTTGDLVELTPDQAYIFEDFFINGSSVYWEGNYTYSYTVLGDTQFRINAHKMATIKATVSIDDPSRITLYNSSYAGGDVINLQSGVNEVELLENMPYLSWVIAPRCYANVTADGVDLGSSTYVNVTEGMNISFVTGQYVADQAMVVWFDNKEAGFEYLSFQSINDRQEITLQTGYSIVDYYSAMLPFGFSWYSSNPTDPYLYLNDQPLSPSYPGGTYYEIEPTENNSVLKIFLTTQPTECDVTFTNADNIPVTIKRDILVPVEGNTLTCFAGTQITVSPASEEQIEVTVNGTTLTAADGGEYEAVVSDTQTEVVIAKAGSSSISEILSGEVTDAPVFNLQGIKVANKSALSNLPAGIYIIEGRKVLVK